MRNKSTIYLTGHFHYYLVSYNTTGVLHSLDEMTECGLPLACCLKCRQLFTLGHGSIFVEDINLCVSSCSAGDLSLLGHILPCDTY